MRCLVWLLLPILPLGADEPADSNACLVCHSNPKFAMRDPDGTVRSLFVEPEAFFDGAHGGRGCAGCHGDLGPGPHGAIAAGNIDPRWRPLLAARSAVTQRTISACMDCHEAEAEAFAKSIHGTQAAAGNLDVPLCDDCHGNHEIRPASDIEHAIAPEKVPETCGSCHADSLLMARYDVPATVVTTYETSFHGRKHTLGEEQVAVCTSCHGVHEIRAAADPLSMVNPANAPATCGQCHTGADARFAASFAHKVPSHEVSPLVYHVMHVHHFILVTVLSVMFLHIFLDLLRRKIEEARGRAR